MSTFVVLTVLVDIAAAAGVGVSRRRRRCGCCAVYDVKGNPIKQGAYRHTLENAMLNSISTFPIGLQGSAGSDVFVTDIDFIHVVVPPRPSVVNSERTRYVKRSNAPRKRIHHRSNDLNPS